MGPLAVQCGENWQVAEGWQGAVMSSKVRMGIARHSGLLFILFLVVCIYKHGSQIIAQHWNCKVELVGLMTRKVGLKRG